MLKHCRRCCYHRRHHLRSRRRRCCCRRHHHRRCCCRRRRRQQRGSGSDMMKATFLTSPGLSEKQIVRADISKTRVGEARVGPT